MTLDKAIGSPMAGGNVGAIGGTQANEGLRNKTQLGLDTIEFKKALRELENQRSTGQNQASPNATTADKLKFSNHAVERMRSRGITFQPEEMKSIEGAIAKAAAKGAKDTLVLSGENALIVSVKNSTIVTVMDRAAMKDNVFTNIDSTVVI